MPIEKPFTDISAEAIEKLPSQLVAKEDRPTKATDAQAPKEPQPAPRSVGRPPLTLWQLFMKRMSCNRRVGVLRETYAPDQ